jgi:hypothetical protein
MNLKQVNDPEVPSGIAKEIYVQEVRKAAEKHKEAKEE